MPDLEDLRDLDAMARASILEAIATAQNYLGLLSTRTREVSMVATKLDEARLWLGAIQ